MTLTSTITGLLSRDTTTTDEQTMTTTADTVDMFDVTHAWVNFDHLSINTAWWQETGRHELREVIQESSYTPVELAREIDYADTYVTNLMSASDKAIPSTEALDEIQTVMLDDGMGLVVTEPVYDVRVEGATLR